MAAAFMEAMSPIGLHRYGNRILIKYEMLIPIVAASDLPATPGEIASSTPASPAAYRARPASRQVIVYLSNDELHLM